MVTLHLGDTTTMVSSLGLSGFVHPMGPMDSQSLERHPDLEAGLWAAPRPWRWHRPGGPQGAWAPTEEMGPGVEAVGERRGRWV